MTSVTPAGRVAAIALCLVIGAAAHGAAQRPTSLPLDPQVYQRIVATRGRVPDPERLEQLIAQYRGEFEIDRIETGQENGRRAAWSSPSQERLALDQRVATARLEAIRSIDPLTLNAPARLDWRVLRERFEANAAWQDTNGRYAFPEFPRVEPPFGNFAETPQTRADVDDRLAWLRGVSRGLKDYEATQRRGVAAGVTGSRADVAAAVARMRAAVPENPIDSPFLKPFTTLPSAIPPNEQKLRLDEAIGIYRDAVVPAYTRYLSFLEQTYLPAARASGSVAGIPGGQAIYTSQIRRTTGLQLSPAAIHEAAVAEVKRLRAELDQLARESGFTGSGADYLIAIKKGPECAPLDAAAAKAAFDTQVERLYAGLGRLFSVLPPIRPEFEAAPDLPFAFGGAVPVNGSPAERRPGRVRTKVPVANACDFLNVMRHEGVPGHLYQSEVAARSDLETSRRLPAGSPAYVEGWAEYASDLAPELGLEQDRHARASRIGGRIFMAGRAAVETGVQWHGWTADKATAYYLESAPWAAPEVVGAVVKGAFDAPARQSMYFVGTRKMHELREYAAKELGPRFDIRRFHDEILQYGSLLLGVLEDQIHDWVAAQKAGR